VKVESNTAIPNGWEWTTLGEACEIILGQSPPSDTYNTEGSGLPFFQGKAEFGDIFPTIMKWCSKPNKIAKAGDILISVRAPVGPTNLCRETCCIGRGLAAIRPKYGMQSKYFLNYLRFIEKDWDSKATGTTFKAITGSVLRKQELPLPPLPEQERIVERIESLFTQLDAGVAGLKRAKAALKRYKASVLKAACEGRLVQQDPNDEPTEEVLKRILAERGDKFTPPDGELGELPKGWCWANIDQFADTIGGLTKGRNFKGKETIMLPYLRVANVQRGHLDLRTMKEIELRVDEIEKYKLLEGDIVLTEGGDWDKLGRSAIWENNIPLCVHQNHIFRARLKSKELSSKWIMYYTNSEQGQNYFKDASKQTTNLASINLTQLRSCPISIPPVCEQRRMVAEIDRQLSVVQELEQTIEANLKRAGRLRQAILKRAFEGRL
jgi:type I restriction enzyme, S subunit